MFTDLLALIEESGQEIRLAHTWVRPCVIYNQSVVGSQTLSIVESTDAFGTKKK